MILGAARDIFERIARFAEEAMKAALSLPHRSDFAGWMAVAGRNESRLSLGALKTLAARIGMPIAIATQPGAAFGSSSRTSPSPGASQAISIRTATPEARIGATQCFWASNRTFSSGMRFLAIVISGVLATA